jgi:hypothetical protein
MTEMTVEILTVLSMLLLAIASVMVVFILISANALLNALKLLPPSVSAGVVIDDSKPKFYPPNPPVEEDEDEFESS